MANTEPKRLTARVVETAKPLKKGERTINDPSVPGLHLRITSTGIKTWAVLYRVNGRRRRLTLGRWPTLGLADARKKAQETLRDVALGGDPARAKQERRDAEAGKGSFGALADRYIEEHAKPRKRSWKEDHRKLRRDVPRSWHHRPASAITRRDVRELVDSKARKAPIAAN